MSRFDDIAALPQVVLIDCEFTCWEESVRTEWGDPQRPPELIEIALVEYLPQDNRVGRSFEAVVRPRINPVLSDYCVRLTHISQAEVDRAARLPEVLAGVAEWLRLLKLDRLVICEWGIGDLPMIAVDAKCHGVTSPLELAEHIALNRFFASLAREHGEDPDRATIRRYFNLPENPNRHRAHADAVDLINFWLELCRHIGQQSSL